MIIQNIATKILELEKRFDEISSARKDLLNDFARYISEKLRSDKIVNLNFICTHNSRRSHMSQIWAQTASEYFEIPNIHCFSGGTEATAFNPRSVRAIRNAGFKIDQENESDNPIYLVHFSEKKEPLQCFSKVYNDNFNPQKDFAAIMTCSHAEKNCPVVFGAEKRFSIKYEDPKEFDGTTLEEEKYRERFEQIGIEMIFVFKEIMNMLK